VQSVLVLLRPQARLANLTGAYERQFPGMPAHVTFRYQVIRVWELPPEQLLAGGLGTVPLAPIGAVSRDEVPGVVRQMQERLRGQQRAVTERLWTATYVLMGLRYPEPFIERMLQGVTDMEESVTYQAIIAKGVAKGLKQGALRELRKTVLLQGRERFGPPDASVKAALDAIDSLPRLEELSLRLLKVDSWQELLQPPRRRARRKPS
jgi:hypothetical protein